MTDAIKEFKDAFVHRVPHQCAHADQLLGRGIDIPFAKLVNAYGGSADE